MSAPLEQQLCSVRTTVVGDSLCRTKSSLSTLTTASAWALPARPMSDRTTQSTSPSKSWMMVRCQPSTVLWICPASVTIMSWTFRISPPTLAATRHALFAELRPFIRSERARNVVLQYLGGKSARVYSVRITVSMQFRVRRFSCWFPSPTPEQTRKRSPSTGMAPRSTWAWSSRCAGTRTTRRRRSGRPLRLPANGVFQ